MPLLLSPALALAQPSLSVSASRPVGLDRAVDSEAVTVEHWQACVDAGVCERARRTQDSRKGALVQVPFDQARAYCDWRETRLPRAEDIEVLGVKVPAHLPTEIDEWVASPPPALPQVRAAGTRTLAVAGSERETHGVRCLWQVAPATAPPLPPFEACLQGRRLAGSADTTEARGSTEEPWTCAGLSVWVEFPLAGPTWLDHWTGSIQSIVAERSDGSYALTFRRHVEPVDGEDDDGLWFLEAMLGEAGIKRKGPIRQARLRDMAPGRRATYRVRIPDQRETRLEAQWLTHAGWDIAMVAGPGTYGGRPDADTTEAFFRSVAPSLVSGWRVPMPGGGWLSVPKRGWSPLAPRMRPDRVSLSFEDLDSGQHAKVRVERSPNGACVPREPPPGWGTQALGSAAGAGWQAELTALATPSGQTSAWITGCASDASVHIEVTRADGTTPTREALQAWVPRLTFPESR